MAKPKVFLFFSLNFILGIFARSFFGINLFAVYLLLIASIILLTLFYRNKNILFSGFAILFFVLGMWKTEKELGKLNYLHLDKQSYSGEALIIKEPEIKNNFQKIVAEVETVDVSNPMPGHPMPKYVKVLINASKYLEYFYGDKIKLDCNLAIPENRKGVDSLTSSAAADSAQDEASSFDYRMYLAKDGISYVCKNAKLELIARGQGNKFYAGILKIKNKFNENINRLIPFPESGLLSGLLLGGNSGLSEKLKDNFSKTGMTHIVAVSGYNVTIVAEYLLFLGIFLGLWRRQAFWFAVFGIFLFVLMIGFPASAVRAGVMGGLLLWAMKNGRLANSRNAVVFAAAAMLFLNPLLLRWDIGFQLSFLATLGIIYFYPFFEKRLDKDSKIFWVWEILFLSLSAQIFVLPIILHNFHNLSLVSLLANVLVLPIIPFTMLLGFLTAVFGFVLAPLAAVFAWLAFLPLKYETLIINFLGNLRYSSLEIENFGVFAAVVWYGVLFGIIYLKKRNKFPLSSDNYEK